MGTIREVPEPSAVRRSVMAFQLERAVTEAHRVFVFDVITCRYVELSRVSFMLALQAMREERKATPVSTVTQGNDLFVMLNHPSAMCMITGDVDG